MMGRCKYAGRCRYYDSGSRVCENDGGVWEIDYLYNDKFCGQYNVFSEDDGCGGWFYRNLMSFFFRGVR